VQAGVVAVRLDVADVGHLQEARDAAELDGDGVRLGGRSGAAPRAVACATRRDRLASRAARTGLSR
jgi:hypothetical protein